MTGTDMQRATLSSKDSRSGCSARYGDPISQFALAGMNSWPCCRNAARMKCVTCLAAWKGLSWNIRGKKSAAISLADSRTTNQGSPQQNFLNEPTTRYTHTSVLENVSPARRFRPQFRNRCLDQEHTQLESADLASPASSHNNRMFLTGTCLKKYSCAALGLLVCYARLSGLPLCRKRSPR